MCDAYCISGAHGSLSFITSSLWVSLCAWQYYCNVNVNLVVSRNAVIFVSVWKKPKMLPLAKLKQVPNESWWSMMCNGYGQTYFGYLIMCHYTVQENCVSLCVWECCLFGSPVSEVRPLWLKVAIHSHRMRCICCAVEAECSAVREILRVLVWASKARPSQWPVFFHEDINPEMTSL